jgi:hypothetical protein
LTKSAGLVSRPPRTAENAQRIAAGHVVFDEGFSRAPGRRRPLDGDADLGFLVGLAVHHRRADEDLGSVEDQVRLDSCGSPASASRSACLTPGRIVSIELGDTTPRVTDPGAELLAIVPRTSTGEISRFKAHGSKDPR